MATGCPQQRWTPRLHPPEAILSQAALTARGRQQPSRPPRPNGFIAIWEEKRASSSLSCLKLEPPFWKRARSRHFGNWHRPSAALLSRKSRNRRFLPQILHESYLSRKYFLRRANFTVPKTPLGPTHNSLYNPIQPPHPPPRLSMEDSAHAHCSPCAPLPYPTHTHTSNPTHHACALPPPTLGTAGCAALRVCVSPPPFAPRMLGSTFRTAHA